jgi:hypothetical protein
MAFDVDADPDTAFHSDTVPDPYLASQNDADLDPHTTVGNYGVFFSYLKTAYMYCFYPEGFFRVKPACIPIPILPF